MEIKYKIKCFMNYKKHIFDIGAYDGLDGIIMAIKNPDILIHAFEANPEQIKKINFNKKKIKNYKINNLAVSNKNSYFQFNIAKNPTVSSLNKFSINLDKSWPGYKDAHCTVIKKIKVKCITLNKYCSENSIKEIDYLHIDTQGSDLKVLKGLKNKIHIVKKGVLEAAVNKKKSLYENSNTINEAKKFLSSNNFSISKIEPVDNNIKNEKNIFFYRKNSKLNRNIIIKYNHRYFYRIINDKTNFKDRVLNNIQIFLNKL